MLKEITKEQINQVKLSRSIRMLLRKQKNDERRERHQQKKLLFLTDGYIR